MEVLYTLRVGSLEELRVDLWLRWQQAFDRIGEPGYASQPGERIVYARVPLFDLRKYHPRRFLPGGRMFKAPPQNDNSWYSYVLDPSGRPVHMTCRHIVNRFDWQGLYLYTGEEAEYTEVCRQTEVVSEYTRIALKEGLPATLQHIRVNGGGSHLGGRTGRAAMEFIRGDTRNYFLQVENYAISSGRIDSGKALMEGLGLPDRRSSLACSYSGAGRLERIVRTHEDGGKSTDYAARSKSSMRELAGRLSEKIAACVIDALKKTAFDSPLLSVELFYRSVTNYVPAVIAVTERDFRANPIPAARMDHRRWMSLNDEDFEPEMAEFMERLDGAEQWNTGTRMLREAALIVARRAQDSLGTAGCFVAFAIDWEFEGQNLPAILKQCGASPAAMKELKAIGWLD